MSRADSFASRTAMARNFFPVTITGPAAHPKNKDRPAQNPFY